MSLEWLNHELELLEETGLLRSPRVLSGATGPEAVIDGHKVLLFCSNDYLGLSGHPRVVDAARSAMDTCGFGACSSRLVSGTNSIHRKLEDRLASWLGKESSLLYPAGFMANLAVLTTLTGRGDVIFSDELNHASIVQGCRLSRAQIVVFPHNDMEALERLLLPHRHARRRLIVTDTIFSVDGDKANLRQLHRLAQQFDATLVVDEAHALGVLGPAGRGLCAEEGVFPDVLVGTLGKAFGASGAFIAGTSELVRFLESRAVSYMYTTAPPPPISAAAMAALEIIEKADDERSRVLAHAERLRSAFASLGCATGTTDSHIVPAIIPTIQRAVAASEELFQKGVFAQVLRPPTVRPGEETLRWTPTSAHTTDQIETALEAFASTFAKIQGDSRL